MAGPPFKTVIASSVAFAFLCVQADGNERNGDEAQKVQGGACLQRHLLSVAKTKREVVWGGAISRNSGPSDSKSDN